MKTEITYNNPDDWELIANVLRDEMQEYAWLLTLLTNQQREILGRNIKDSAATNGSIESQASIVSRLKCQRQELVEARLIELNIDPSEGINALFAHIPVAMRSMFEALVAEIRSLLKRIHRRAAQNERLLRRATELNAVLLDGLRLGSVGRLYGQRGQAYRKANGLTGHMIRTVV